MNGRRLWALASILVVTGCVAPSGAGKPPMDNPIIGGAIATTSLDGPTKPIVAKPKHRPEPDKTDPVKVEPEKADAGKSEVAKATNPVTQPAKQPPTPPLSPEGQACVKKGGIWGKAGRGLGNTCVKRTKDSGKSCQRGSQCEGDCLARSQTCAPYNPLFGCNAILQDNGLEVTLCID